MKNRESFGLETHRGDDSENINERWTTLKELAEEEAFDRIGAFESIDDEEQRAKYRERGKKLLRVIRRMEKRPSEDEKAMKVERIQRLAENIGVGDELQSTLDRYIERATNSKIGEAIFAENPDLSPEE